MEKKQKTRRVCGMMAAFLAVVMSVSMLVSCNLSMTDITLKDNDEDSASLLANGTGAAGTKKHTVPENTELNYAKRVMTATEAGTVATVYANVSATVVEIQTETKSTYYGTTSGAGSGVIVTENGYIVTCYHVVEGCTSIYVSTNDGTQYTASFVGGDTWSDIAVLKIDADRELPYATFATAESDNQQYIVPGEQVIAIGNPLGYLGGSVTVGYISALDRSITIDGVPMTLLQTDTAVSPGNSGGGLFNLYGELVGIVNAKSAVDNAENIGFAIPSDYTLYVVDQILKQGYVSGRPYLGISFSGSTSGGGLVVNRYEYNSELAALNSSLKSGFEIKEGDILTAIDGSEVSDYADVRTAIAGKNVGDTVVLTVYRASGRTPFGSSYSEYKVTVKIHEKTASAG